MFLDDRLKEFGNVPFNKATLINVLPKYKSLNDKVSKLIKEGKLIQLKRGLYLVSSKITKKQNSLEVIANSLYGPSCISLDYALSYYGFIPERVFKVTSVTTGAKKQYSNSLAAFEYYHLPDSLFSIGIITSKTPDGSTFLIASKEKALCDKLLLSKNFRINSMKTLREFLLSDLRIDIDMFKGLNTDLIDGYIKVGFKKQSLLLLKRFIAEVS